MAFASLPSANPVPLSRMLTCTVSPASSNSTQACASAPAWCRTLSSAAAAEGGRGTGLAGQDTVTCRSLNRSISSRRSTGSSGPSDSVVAFAALAGAPLQESKHTKAGLARRRELLHQAGLTLPPKVPGAAENDLLDAAAVAWSARRIASGDAITITNPAQRSDDSTQIAIRY